MAKKPMGDSMTTGAPTPSTADGLALTAFTTPPPGTPTPMAPGETRIIPTTIRVSRTVRLKLSSSTPVEEAHSSEPDETIEVHQFATTPASCYVGIDLKKSKDFNSAGVMIGVTLPCYTEELKQGIEKAYATVMERLMVELPKIIKAAYDLRDARIAERDPK